MAITERADIERKLVPIEFKLSGTSMDLGRGELRISQAWRYPDGALVQDRSAVYDLAQELQDQTEYAGITPAQMLAFFAAYFEAKEQAERGRLAAEIAAQADLNAQNGE